MKLLIITLLIPISAFTTMAQTKGKTVVKKKTVVTTKKPVATAFAKNTLDSASYAFGISMAEGLKERGLTTLNYDLLVKGLRDVFTGNKVMLTSTVAQTSISKAFTQANKSKYTGNIAEGKAFLESNKKVAGVKTTASGLQYMVIKEGNGIKPKATDTVLAHYKGTLLNGKQFDSSYDRNEPLSLPLNNVIAGWTEGMQLMSTGSKYRLFIPYNLAYGERGAGQDIPPYSTLVFEIELLKVNGK
ncbi:FKBP-type peptidyl-prolyl cis-trans isomerase [Pedobacter sp. MC2016-14]|uniref:FKBP-type peptidyl-prolyl cis-trans isomerase n=1 Tax=Pedobacter sp. MC2016-14 TaxID=2897327 RepID=UPI001E41FD83|nr:FKBP-type peptidyl-prolyl cis-trans isomerase [Pedobacter sp. MC2016-14]MCD0487967.1 FKBP-type peptidyl-prolyl cis-trans isomerase [Pedobacter sp. MC2016-14]